MGWHRVNQVDWPNERARAGGVRCGGGPNAHQWWVGHGITGREGGGQWGFEGAAMNLDPPLRR